MGCLDYARHDGIISMKKLIKPIFYFSSILLFLTGTIWTLKFAHHQQNERVCNDVRIFINTNNGEVFITEDEIIEKLFAAKLHPQGQLTTALNTQAIEDYLLRNSAIQAVNVFTKLSGEMGIEVVQRQPIVRIENAQRQQFYIGSDGHLMAVNPNHTARLIIASGNITESFYPDRDIAGSTTDPVSTNPILHKIYQLVTHIRNDEFLNTFIDQIYINSKQEFELVPKIGNQLILLGNAENYEDQFKRLHHFFHHGVKKVGWDAYRIINLKYNNQVVCTKV
jgi:cell division protein FtsQ